MGPSAYNPESEVEALRCLYFGVDTLEITWAGAVAEGDEIGLDYLKELARARRRPERITLGGVPFGVTRTGLKPWAWVLTNADMHLRIGRRIVKEGRKSAPPAAGLKLLSVGIAASGCAELVARAERALAAVGSFGAARVSRIDVAFDVQGCEFDLATMRGMVCPASFRPVYPNIDAPESFQFGRGDVVVRVYNKTVEAAAKGSHWPDYWREVPGYRADQDVWRVEVQLRGKVLREAKIKTPRDALSRLEALMVYGLDWASLRVASESDTNRSRWPEHEVWSWIRRSLVVSEPIARIRETATGCDALALIPQLAGMLVSVGAHLGIREPDRAMRWVLAAMGEYHADRGVDFGRLVGERQEERYGVACIDGLSPLYGYLGL